MSKSDSRLIGDWMPFCGCLAGDWLFSNCCRTGDWLQSCSCLTGDWLFSDCCPTGDWLLSDCFMTGDWLFPDCGLAGDWLLVDELLTGDWLLFSCCLTADWSLLSPLLLLADLIQNPEIELIPAIIPYYTTSFYKVKSWHKKNEVLNLSCCPFFEVLAIERHSIV